jgi:hypothetical protein
MPKHGLSDGRHHHLERIKLPGHLGMASDYNLHPLKKGPHFRGVDYGQGQLRLLIYKRVTSSARTTHYLSASSHHRSALATLSAKPRSFSLAMSQAWRASTSSSLRRVTSQTTSSTSPLAEASVSTLSQAPLSTCVAPAITEVIRAWVTSS